MYADTDFFLALLKPEDWLKDKAKEAYKEHKDELWTSEITFIELMLLARRFALDTETLTVSALSLCGIKGVKEGTLLLASHYIKEGVNVFDAFHAAHAEHDRILSSDDVYEKIGLKQVDLKDL